MLSAVVAAESPTNPAPELVLQSGHGSFVNELIFSGDGRVLVSRDAAGEIKVWDVPRRSLIRTLTRNDVALHPGFGSPIAVSGSGEHLLIGRPLGDVVELLVSTGAIRNSYPTSPATTGSAGNSFKIPAAVAESPDGKWVIVGDSEGGVIAFNSEQNVAQIIQRTGPAASAVWLGRNGGRVLLRRDDGSIIIRDLETGLSYDATGFTMGITAVAAVTEAGDVLVTDRDSTGLQLINLTGRRKVTVPCSCVMPMLSADGSTLAALEGDEKAMRRVRVWSTTDMRETASLVPPAVVMRAVLNVDGTMLGFGGYDGTVSLLPVRAQGVVSRLSQSVRVPVAIQWRGSDTLAVIDADGGIDAWNLKQGSTTTLFRSGQLAYPAVSATGRFLVWRGASGELVRGDAMTPDTERLGITVQESLHFLAISDDGTAVAWASGNLRRFEIVERSLADLARAAESAGKREPRVWLPLKVARRGQDGWTVREVCRVNDAIPSAAFAGNTLMVAGCTPSEPRAEGEQVESAADAVWAGGGRRLVVGRQRMTLVEGSERTTITTGSIAPLSAAMSPDGKWAVVVDYGGRVEVIDVVRRSSKTWTPRSGFDDWALATGRRSRLIAISNDGSVYAVGESGSVQAHTRDGRPLFRLIGVGADGWLVVASDGRFDSDDVEAAGAVVKWRMADEPARVLPLEIFIRDYYHPRLAGRILTGDPPLSIIPALDTLNRNQPEIRRITVSEEDGRTDRVSVSVEVASTAGRCWRPEGPVSCESGVFDVRLFRDGGLVDQAPIPVATVAERSTEDRVSNILRWRETAIVRDENGQAITVADGPREIVFRHVRLPQREGVDQVSFTAYAFNSDRVKSDTAPPVWHRLRARTEPRPRRAFVITMGVNANDSQDPWRLGLAVSSAERARSLLRGKLRGHYPDVVEVSLYADVAADSAQAISKRARKAHLKAVFDLLAGRENAVTTEIRQNIDPERRLRQATPDDIVVLYIASHGYADPEGAFHVIPYDTGAHWGLTPEDLDRCTDPRRPDALGCEDVSDFLAHTISGDELAGWWRGVDAADLVMILDSCHSGAVPGRDFRPGPFGDRNFGQLSYDKGLRVLAAAQSAQTAYGDWMGAGEGRTLLIEALEQSAASDPDQGLVEWLRTAEHRVPLNARLRNPGLNVDTLQAPRLIDFTYTRESAAKRYGR